MGDVIRVGYELTNEFAQAPCKAYPTDSGFDVVASQTITVRPREIVKVGLGIKFEIPLGYEMQVRLRSSIGNNGLFIPTGLGTVDPEYRGEIFLSLGNISKWVQVIYPTNRVAQLILAPILNVEFYSTQVLNNTSRGTGGCGSTGR